jgi:excinuclease UvrABC helicase subunit UvrB
MQLGRAVQALNDGIQAVEEFLAEYGLEDETGKSRERNMLIDLRRSLRERYNIPITDDELLQSLKAEQEVAIQQEDFEMAARLRDKINLLLAKLNGTP